MQTFIFTKVKNGYRINDNCGKGELGFCRGYLETGRKLNKLRYWPGCGEALTQQELFAIARKLKQLNKKGS
jgi:hypothetical protein